MLCLRDPNYNLIILRATALFMGEKDELGDVDDNVELISQLAGNPALVEQFSHMIFSLGTQNAYNTWFPDLENLLRKYKPVPEAELV